MAKKYRPWITALAAMLLIMFLFAASHALERYIDPSISPESKTQFHLARDLGVSFVVALLIVFVSEWRMRQVEDNLEKRERHVAEVLKESTNAIVCADPDGEIVYWNRGAEILYGYRPGEILGQSVQKIVPKHEAKNDDDENPSNGNEATAEFLAQRLTKNGEKVSVLVRREDSGDEIKECVGCKAVQDNLGKLRELEQQLSHSEQLATVGEMAAGLAHEIKNPLAGIAGAIQILGETLPTEDDRREVVEKVLEQVQRIDGTVRDLLAYARPKAARLAPTDLHEVINAALRVVVLFPQTRINVVRHYQNGLPKPMIDGQQFGQVLSNLFINAIQAMQDGGTLTITTTSDPKGIHVSVRDTGKGVPKSKLSRIFDPFYTTKTRGTGLGLPICRRVVEAHHGTILVNSRSGQGAEFVIELPHPHFMERIQSRTEVTV
jgi:PAS domain S-box-containing protein